MHFRKIVLCSLLILPGTSVLAGPIRVSTTVFAPVTGSQLGIQAAAATPDGGLYVYCTRQDPGPPNQAGFLVRFLPSGARAWGRPLNQNQFSGGFFGAMRTVRLLPTPDNGVIVLYERVTNTPPTSDIIINRFGSSGNLSASRSILRTSSNYYSGALRRAFSVAAANDNDGSTWVGFNFFGVANERGIGVLGFNSDTLEPICGDVAVGTSSSFRQVYAVVKDGTNARALISSWSGNERDRTTWLDTVKSYRLGRAFNAVTYSSPITFSERNDFSSDQSVTDFAVSGDMQLGAFRDPDRGNLVNVKAFGPSLRTMTTLDRGLQNAFVATTPFGPNTVAFANEVWDAERSGFVASLSYVAPEGGAPAFAGGAFLPGFANEWNLPAMTSDPVRRTLFVPGGASSLAAPFPVGVCLNRVGELIYRIASPISNTTYSQVVSAQGRRIWAVGTDTARRLVVVQYREPEYFVGLSGQVAPVPAGTSFLMRFHFAKAAPDGGYPITVVFDPRVFTQRTISFQVFGGTDVELPVTVRADAPLGTTLITARTSALYDEAATHSALVEIKR
jgi:hypothetical protein